MYIMSEKTTGYDWKSRNKKRCVTPQVLDM